MSANETPFDPEGMATMGGRGKDPALMAQIAEQRDAPPKHVIHVSSIQTWNTPTPYMSALEAFDQRVKRLRESGKPYEADRDALTISYAYQTDETTTTVHLSYTDVEADS